MTVEDLNVATDGSQADTLESDCGPGEFAPQPTTLFDLMGSTAAVEVTKNVTFGAAVDEADLAIGRLHEETEGAHKAAEKELSLGLPAVQDCLYSAIVHLIEHNLIDSFLAARGVKQHGNAKNPFTAILRGFANGKHKGLRQALSRSAAFIGVAHHLKTAPVDFAAWRQTVRAEDVVQQWREIQRASRGDEIAELVAKFLLPDPDAPWLPPVRKTAGYKGRRLAVIDCADDGSGKHRFVALLPCAADEIPKVLSAILRKSVKKKV